MIPRELLEQVRRIEIRTRRVVDDITAGAYHSAFKGRGIEFDEVREYEFGDDVRDIDWNVTARMDAPFIKKYVEERELTVLLMVDASASTLYGGGDKAKRAYAAETAALLAFSAIRNNDRVGLLVFTDTTELYLPPRSGRTHGLRLIREVLAASPRRVGTNLAVALEAVSRALHKRAVIFIISDFIDNSAYDKALRIANRRHDIIAVRILDPLEVELPAVSGLVVEDAETGESVLLPGTSRRRRRRFAEAAAAARLENERICRRAKVDMIDIRCGDDFVKPFVKFFKTRGGKH